MDGLALADQPQVPVTLLRAMIALNTETLSPIVAPLVKGQRVNPVMFDRVTYKDLMRIQGDQGGRAVFSRYPTAWQEWHDENLLLDIDTIEDYRRLVELYG